MAALPAVAPPRGLLAEGGATGNTSILEPGRDDGPATISARENPPEQVDEMHCQAALAARRSQKSPAWTGINSRQGPACGTTAHAMQRANSPDHIAADRPGVAYGFAVLVAGLSRPHRERHVHGGEHHRQTPRVEHHPDVAGAGELGQQLAVPAPAQTSSTEGSRTARPATGLARQLGRDDEADPRQGCRFGAAVLPSR